MEPSESLQLDTSQFKSLEDLLGLLELYHGAWAVRLKGDLYVFPQDTTRAQVVSVLTDAYNLAKGGFN